MIFVRKKFFVTISIILSFILVILYVFTCKISSSIEHQVARELGVTEHNIFLFDMQVIGEYQIAGVCYGPNQYGLVWMLDKNDRPKLIWVATSDEMVCRADKVWAKAMAIRETAFYAFLSANADLTSIVWEDKNGITITYIDHVPSLVLIPHSIGHNFYQLRDKQGVTLQ